MAAPLLGMKQPLFATTDKPYDIHERLLNFACDIVVTTQFLHCRGTDRACAFLPDPGRRHVDRRQRRGSRRCDESQGLHRKESDCVAGSKGNKVPPACLPALRTADRGIRSPDRRIRTTREDPRKDRSHGTQTRGGKQNHPISRTTALRLTFRVWHLAFGIVHCAFGLWPCAFRYTQVRAP